MNFSHDAWEGGDMGLSVRHVISRTRTKRKKKSRSRSRKK